MKAEITQYGKGIKAGGWDKYGDSYTDQFLGNLGTIYSGVSCAITKPVRLALNLVNGDWLKIVFPGGQVYYRRVDDEAPEDNARVDFFNYFAFDTQMDGLGDTAEITKVIMP
jgi:hypothetical protein